MEYYMCQSILNSTKSTNYNFISPNSSFLDLNDTFYLKSTTNYTSKSFDYALSKIEYEIHIQLESGATPSIPLNYSSSKDIWKNLAFPDYLKIFLYVIVIVGGLLGNISVIVTVILNKSMWKTINIYIVNLAVADTMICIFCMLPHALTVVTTKVYKLGKIMCKLNTFIEMTCLICSVLTLSIITWNCRLAIMFPLKDKTSKKCTFIFAIVMWTVSIAVSIPLLIVREHLEIKWLDFTEYQCSDKWPIYWYVDRTTNRCVSQQTTRLLYYIVVLTTLYFLPLVIMTVACSSILWTLQKNKIGGEQTARSRNIKKATRSVVFLFFVFITCWTPIQVIVIYSAFFPQDSSVIPQWIIEIQWASHFLAYSNSFLNPIIYGGYNRVVIPGVSGHTFITRLTSSLSRQFSKLRNDANNTLHKSNMEMKLVHPVGNGDISPAAGDNCASRVEAKQ